MSENKYEQRVRQRAEEMEEELKKNTFSYTSVFTDRAALGEKLAATEKMMVKYKSDLDRSTAERLRQAQLLQSYKDRSDDVDAVKKERDDFAKMVDREVIAKNKAQYQRDEAVKLLGKAHDLIEGDLHEFMTREERATCMDIRQGFERLSSGETKPVSTTPDEYPGKAYQPLFDHMSKEHNLTLLESEMQEIIGIVRKMDSQWISVEDQLPEEGKDYNFIVDIPHSDYHGRVLGGKYIGHRFGQHEFATPGCGYNATLYCPIPAPPESLTDK